MGKDREEDKEIGTTIRMISSYSVVSEYLRWITRPQRPPHLFKAAERKLHQESRGPDRQWCFLETHSIMGKVSVLAAMNVSGHIYNHYDGCKY